MTYKWTTSRRQVNKQMNRKSVPLHKAPALHFCGWRQLNNSTQKLQLKFLIHNRSCCRIHYWQYFHQGVGKNQKPMMTVLFQCKSHTTLFNAQIQAQRPEHMKHILMQYNCKTSPNKRMQRIQKAVMPHKSLNGHCSGVLRSVSGSSLERFRNWCKIQECYRQITEHQQGH